MIPALDFIIAGAIRGNDPVFLNHFTIPFWPSPASCWSDFGNVYRATPPTVPSEPPVMNADELQTFLGVEMFVSLSIYVVNITCNL